jgi:hypothetical protein
MNRAAVKAAVRAQLPRCPGLYADEIAERLAERALIPQRLAHDILAMANSVIRHQLTDYDALRTRHELTPEEARFIVQPEVDGWLEQWRAG